MIKKARSSFWEKELVEGKLHAMGHLPDLYKLLHVSEPLFIHVEEREIKSYLPGRVL